MPESGASLPQDPLALLRVSEQRHRLLAEAANDVIWTMSLDGAITYVSPAVERVRGFTPEEAMAQAPEEITTPESTAITARYFADLRAAMRDGREPPHRFRGVLEYLCKDGSVVIADVQVIPHIDTDGNLIEILGVSRDITASKRAEAELLQSRQAAMEANDALLRANEALQRLATKDALTGISNRRHFDALLAEAAADAVRTGRPSSLILFDIDRFKRINDTLGHQEGDRVLVEVTNRLSRRLRATDALGRWGGEEFVVLARGIGIDDAMGVAEDMRHRVEATPFRGAGCVTVSAGVAEWHPGGDVDAWIIRADTAMYRAKDAGRNVVFADDPRPVPAGAASG